MGSTGKKKTSTPTAPIPQAESSPQVETQGEQEQGTPNVGGFDLIKQQSEDENDLEGVTTFTDNSANTVKWFNNPKLSNHSEWKDNLLTYNEQEAIQYYTGSWYHSINPYLYNIPWDKLDDSDKKRASDLYHAINKFELNKAIKTVRQCGFQIFGSNTKMSAQEVINYLNNETVDGHIQINGFLSSTTRPSGTFAANKGVWIDLYTPPNKGGCAYVSSVGGNSSESEVLYNNNAILKFDASSVHYNPSDGYVHVSAQWVGQATDQHFKNKKK